MGLLTKDQIWAVDDTKTIDVHVKDWGGDVRLRTLSGAERDKFEADSIDQRKGSNNTKMNLINLRARLVVLCAVDEGGKRMFPDSEVAKLGAKSSLALNTLFEAARELNGMTEADVEELTEGFDSGQSEE